MSRINGKIFSTKEKFFSSLSNKGMSDRNYKHAERVRSKFKMKEIEY